MKQRKEGAVYKTCIYCGLKWNVSIKDRYKYYVCPVCRSANKHKEE